jgi:hypothetical protein
LLFYISKEEDHGDNNGKEELYWRFKKKKRARKIDETRTERKGSCVGKL